MSETATPLAPAKVLQDLLKSRQKSIEAVAAKGLDAQRVIKIVLGAAMRNPTLLKCEPNSVLRSVIQAVELGLEPGGALGEAHLVPFWNNKVSRYECQLIVDYKGIAALMYRSGLVDFITAEVVYEGDDFEYELGMNPKLRHVPMDETIDPLKITHAYMVVGIKGGAKVFKVMTRKAIERIRLEFSQQGKDNKGPWRDHYAEQAKKTVVKNGAKLVPKSIEVARIVQFDDAMETGDWSAIDFDSPDALPEPTETQEQPKGQVSKTAERIRKATNGSTIQEGVITSEEPTFLQSIGLVDGDIQDFYSFCQGEELNPAEVIENAKEQGIATKASLYDLAQSMKLAGQKVMFQ